VPPPFLSDHAIDAEHQVENMAQESKMYARNCLYENDIDLETLSTLRERHGGDEV
jgi:hypothetical protein